MPLERHVCAAVKQRQLDLLTRFGWIRLKRWQMRDVHGSYSCPLDPAWPGPAPARQPIDHRASCRPGHPPSLPPGCFSSRRLRRGNDRSPQPSPPWPGPSAGLRKPARRSWPKKTNFKLLSLSTEWSRPGIGKNGRSCWPNSTARTVGILTTGKSLVSPTAKNRRYRLEERVGYGGVETAQDFGERLFLKGEAHLGFSWARHLKWVPAKYKEGNRKEPSRKN